MKHFRLRPHSFVLVASLLSFSWTAVAQEMALVPLSGAAVAEAFLEDLPACDVLDFTSDGVMAQMGRPDKLVNADWLRVIYDVSLNSFPIPFQKERKALRSQNPFPKNEQAYASWPKNDRTRGLIGQLSRRLETARTELRLADLNLLADTVLAHAKSQGRVGECYKISQVTGSWNTEWTRIESLTPEVQAAMDSLFLRPLRPPLSSYEVSLLQNGRFTAEELAELRALKLATKIFEQHTSLRLDKGGYAGNLPGLNALLRTVCRTEAQTYYFFVRRLQARGLLKHFAFRDMMALRKTKNPFDGHGATLIESRRTHDLVVIDSWHEDGGNAAHITLYADWIAAQDRADIIAEQ